MSNQEVPMFANLISLLFYSRDYAHRAHLRTESFAAHTALDGFYTTLPGLIDSLVETYQGLYGLIDIPFACAEDDDILQPTSVLRRHLDIINGTRSQAIAESDTALLNILDEVVALYASTLYKLRFLK